MVKLATWIVDKRNLIFLVTVIGLLFSAVSRNWVEVENDLTSFLPEESDTKKALNVMDGQFTTFGSTVRSIMRMFLRCIPLHLRIRMTMRNVWKDWIGLKQVCPDMTSLSIRILETPRVTLLIMKSASS